MKYKLDWFTDEQWHTSRVNRAKARERLNVPKGYDLHHKDENLRRNDVERYILWLDEDLEVLSHSEHAKLHSGKKHSEETKKKISESLKGRKLSAEHKEKIRQLMIGNQRAKKMV